MKSRLCISALLSISCLLLPSASLALSLKDVILYVLETNPDIKTAESNKQAIEFELDQARSLRAPRFELEAFAGSSLNDGSTTPDLSSADSWVNGYEISGRVSQLLFDGFETRSEIDRQAYRIDAAAYRVLERSEVLSLEAVRLYSDVLRIRSLTAFAKKNRDYHSTALDRVRRAYDQGVVSIGDLQQAEERFLLAEDTILAFDLDKDDIESLFLAVVGVEPKGLGTVPNIAGSVPSNLEAALQIGRTQNPSILFLQSDIGAAEAQSRRVDANAAPKLFLEADGRFGNDVGGYEGNVADAKVGLVLRYEFQGTSKRSARQEQIRRVGESRSRLLSQTRLVEREVRQSWSTLQSAQRRTKTIQAQADIALKLRQTYEAEFDVGQRSLLDVLNTQNALFQAQANLVNARSLENYVRYRILASIGILLPTLDVPVPEDAKVYARERQGVPALDKNGDRQRLDAKSFKEWRKSLE
ncbi:agglutination protein [Sulfitobacter sp. SK012]|uniref:TolC family protein n=1 Tax=Sulfitobacter sp. SK012 TaxID=1389005 RepID=UPI000E0ADD87|nr:TolC family protein [Sulfitobacter sp. SK012]AXI45595.1 agglutination protein [Sulfitobacter sp. SK012]